MRLLQTVERANADAFRHAMAAQRAEDAAKLEQLKAAAAQQEATLDAAMAELSRIAASGAVAAQQMAAREI